MLCCSCSQRAKPNDKDSSIYLSSSFVRQFSIPLEITELCPSPTPSKLQLPTSFYKADVPIVVFNPLTTPLSTLKTLNVPSHTVFVASQSPYLNDTTLQRNTLSGVLPQSPLARLLFVDPPRAVAAIQTFQSNPTSTHAIQQYQDNFTSSGIPLVTRAIRDVVDSGANTSSSAAYLRNRTAIIQLHDTLNAFKSNIEDIERSLNDIRLGINQLSGKVKEAKVRIPRDVLTSDDGFTSTVGQDAVKSSLTLASKEVKEVLEKLSWWKTIWRVDEISGIVGSAVDRIWCKDLEKKVCFFTGFLAIANIFLVDSTLRTPVLPPTRIHEFSCRSCHPPNFYPLQPFQPPFLGPPPQELPFPNRFITCICPYTFKPHISYHEPQISAP